MAIAPICPECGSESVLVSNTVVYGEKPTREGNVWCCPRFPVCDNYIAANRDDPMASPVGSMAGPRLRELRSKIIELLRPRWETKKPVSKNKVMFDLAKDLGWTGRLNVSFLSIEQALQVLEFIKPGFSEEPTKREHIKTWQDQQND